MIRAHINRRGRPLPPGRIIPSLLACLVAVSCQSLIVPDDDLKREFLEWKFGMFVHFGMATFTDREWANGYENPAAFAPDTLDINQWVDAAEAAGMQYAVLTVKHTGGWALWDSRHTDHDASAFVNFRNGKGDVVREFVETFRRRGIKVGLYYCLPGRYDDRFGNTLPHGQPSLRGLPSEARGEYEGFVMAQLTELLTDYGPIDLMWMDQARSHYLSRGAWIRIRTHIKGLQPGAYVIGNNLPFPESDIESYEYPLDPERGFPPADNVNPAEVSDRLGPTWFWNSSGFDTNLKPATEIVDMLTRANARNANYLLNVAPDTTGRIPGPALDVLWEVGEVLRERLAGHGRGAFLP